MMAGITTVHTMKDPDTGNELRIIHVWGERSVVVKMTDGKGWSEEVAVPIEDWRSLFKQS
jgi:hypothetical protein